jgi:hypothetical protein
MKKLNFIFVVLFMTIFTSMTFGQKNQVVDFQVSIFDPTGPLGNPHKSPIDFPEVSLDDHTLYFGTSCDGCTLNIVDENNVVVYTLVIPSGTTSLVLPSTLSGKYELQLISGNYLFWGVITL